MLLVNVSTKTHYEGIKITNLFVRCPNGMMLFYAKYDFKVLIVIMLMCSELHN